METPQADYDELLRIYERMRGQSATSDDIKEGARLLHRLRPRGVKLTCNALVKTYDLVSVESYYLCCTRKADAHLPVGERRVCLPGDHVDPEDFLVGGSLNETIQHAALRELEEETGLKGIETEIIYRDIDECGTLCYMVTVSYDNPANANKPEEGTALLWLTREQLLARAAWPGYYGRAAESGAL